jgi:hypothetical protein
VTSATSPQDSSPPSHYHVGVPCLAAPPCCHACLTRAWSCECGCVRWEGGW